jgi:hypothetical protein
MTPAVIAVRITRTAILRFVKPLPPAPCIQLMARAKARAPRTVPMAPVGSRRGLPFWFCPSPGGGLDCAAFDPAMVWPLSSCDATMVYRNCSRNFELPARSILEATAV